MTIPKLARGEFGVLFAETATGKILCLNGERYNGSGEFYEVFGSFDLAQAYARAHVDDVPGIEASVRDSDGTHVAFVKRNTGSPVE